MKLSSHPIIAKSLRYLNRKQGYRILDKYEKTHALAPVYPREEWCFLLPADHREPYFSCGTLVALRSIRATNPGIPVVIIYSNLSDSQKSALDGCELMQVDEGELNADHRPDIGAITLLRFHAQNLPYSRVISLDADAVVVDSLEELFTDPCPLMARSVDLPLSKEFRDPRRAAAALPIKDGYPLIFGGLMAFSTPYWRKHDALGMCQSLAAEFGWDFFINSDQSTWIAISYLTGGFKALAPEYNFMNWSDMAPAQGQTTTSSTGHMTAVSKRSHARVLHWVGGIKPWMFDEHKFDEEKRHLLFEKCYLQFKSQEGVSPG